MIKRHTRYSTSVVALLLAFSLGVTSVDARIIEDRTEKITYDKAREEFERVLANNHYEDAIQKYILSLEEGEKLVDLTRLSTEGLGSLSSEAIKGYSLSSGFDKAYYNYSQISETTYAYTLNITFDKVDTFEDRVEAQKTLDSIEEHIVKNYTLNTTYDVLYAVNDYIVKNYDYSVTPGGGYSPYTLSHFLKTKKGVCHVYAALAEELLSRFGIENKIILGKINNLDVENPYHAWLGVKIGGNWYNFDPTWNDPRGSSGTTTYLAVPSTYFASEGNSRDFYVELDATSTSVDKNEPYSYANHKGKYTEYNNQKYLDNYWGINSYNESKKELKFNFMDVNKDKKYILEIEPKGRVYVNIDGTRIEINGIKNTELLKQKVTETAISGVYVENNVIKAPITSKELILTYDDNKPSAKGYIADPALVYENSITDIKDTYFELYALSLYERGIVNGTTATTFSPNSNVTKGQLIAILGRQDGVKDGVSVSNPKYGKSFSGTHFDYFKNSGVIPYKYLSNFKSGDAITRVEVANILYNYLSEHDVALSSKGVTAFTDKREFKIASDHTKALALKNLGIFEGNEKGKFEPYSNLTRGQLAKIIYKTLELTK